MRVVQLRVGTFTKSLLIDLATSDGRFADTGLEVVESSVPSSPAQFRSLEAGEFDVVLTSPDNVLAYRFLSANPLQRRLPVVVLAALDRGLGLSMCLSPSTNSVDDVRAKTVGVDVPQSGFAFALYELLDLAGVAPGDYSIEAMGSTPRRAVALTQDQCAATILNAGNELRAKSEGCTIARAVSDLGPYLGTVVAGLATTDDETIDARRRFIEVLLATASDVVAGERTEEVVRASMSLLDLNELDAREHVRIMVSPTTGLIPSGVVDLDAVATLVRLRAKFAPTVELDTVLTSFPAIVEQSSTS